VSFREVVQPRSGHLDARRAVRERLPRE
jgi:hypothetical protein